MPLFPAMLLLSLTQCSGLSCAIFPLHSLWLSLAPWKKGHLGDGQKIIQYFILVRGLFFNVGQVSAWKPELLNSCFNIAGLRCILDQQRDLGAAAEDGLKWGQWTFSPQSREQTQEELPECFLSPSGGFLCWKEDGEGCEAQLWGHTGWLFPSGNCALGCVWMKLLCSEDVTHITGGSAGLEVPHSKELCTAKKKHRCAGMALWRFSLLRRKRWSFPHTLCVFI